MCCGFLLGVEDSRQFPEYLRGRPSSIPVPNSYCGGPNNESPQSPFLCSLVSESPPK